MYLVLGFTTNSNPNNIEEPEMTTKSATDTDDLNSVIMIIIPLVLTLVIIAVIVCVVMICRRGRIQDAGMSGCITDSNK